MRLLFSHGFRLAAGDASICVAPAGGLGSGAEFGWSAGNVL